MSNTTAYDKELCPMCKGDIVTSNIENGKYCIKCGYKVPPYTETFFTSECGTLITEDMFVSVESNPELEVRDDGIYIPAVREVAPGCAPKYNLLISKETFIEAYNKYIKNIE